METLPDEILLRIIREVTASNPGVFPPPFSVVVRENLRVEPSSRMRSEAAAQVFREGRHRILTVKRRVLVEFTTSPRPGIVVHRGSLEVDDDVEPAITIADNALLAAWRMTEDLIYAAKAYERFRKRHKRAFALGPTGENLKSFDEFESEVYATLDRNPDLFPEWMISRLDRGIGVSRDSHYLDGRLVLGWFTHDQYGRGIDIFHGSFMDLSGPGGRYGTDRDYMAGILDVLVHEFFHHAGSIKGSDPVAKLEWSRDAIERPKLSEGSKRTHMLIIGIFLAAAAVIAAFFIIAALSGK